MDGAVKPSAHASKAPRTYGSELAAAPRDAAELAVTAPTRSAHVRRFFRALRAWPWCTCGALRVAGAVHFLSETWQSFVGRNRRSHLTRKKQMEWIPKERCRRSGAEGLECLSLVMMARIETPYSVEASHICHDDAN